MDARQQRGMVIAATMKITAKPNDIWSVPSQSSSGRYTVMRFNGESRCTCPDYEAGFKCKHCHAVEIVIQRELFDDGRVEETRSVTVTEKRTTYPQAWSSYNAAQTNEAEMFQVLLADLCKTLPAPEPKPGRPKIKPADAAFSAILKVYSTMSARRFNGDLKAAKESGYVSHVPHFNSVLNFFDTDEATMILEDFVTKSAAPLAGVEDSFAIDSTGFSGGRYLQWIDKKYGQPKREVAWIKLHAVIGTKTNVVAACKVGAANSSDTGHFPMLAAETAKNFNMVELSADKAYTTYTNYELSEKMGFKLYAAFQKRATGGLGGAFARAFHFMQLNREEWEQHYHRRSNCESAFSAMKRKLGADLRSKTDRAMKNETYAKVVAYNITCVVAAMYELGISPLMGCTNTLAAAHKRAYGE